MARSKNTVVAPEKEGYRIEHVYGPLRDASLAYLEKNHYMKNSGHQGRMYAVLRDADTVAGACLVGETLSDNQKADLVVMRSIAGACLVGESGSPDIRGDLLANDAEPSIIIQQIKRSHILDEVPTTAVCESKLIRRAMQHVTDILDRPVLFVSYADLGAKDERTGRPLLGKVYQSAGFFFAGFTSSNRKMVLDHNGQWHPTKYGKLTFTRKNLPHKGSIFNGELVTSDWTIHKAPEALVWLAVCTPNRMTRKQAKTAFRKVMAAIHPKRKLAAYVWINHPAWRRELEAGTRPIGEPKPEHMRELDRFQPAYWRGDQITRTAAPCWPRIELQNEIVFEEDVEGETVANRVYLTAA